MYYLGIDVSKASSHCVIIDNNGERFKKPFVFKNNHDNFSLLLSQISSFDISKDDLLLGIEATGIWWENLFCFLSQKGFKIILLNPHQTNKFREALRKKAKTDDIDAYVIAGLLRSNEYLSCSVPEENIQALREATKLRYQFVKDRKSYMRQTLSLLSLVFPEYQTTALKNPFAIASLAILKKFPTAYHLAHAKVKHIEKIVRSIKGNNFPMKHIQALIDTAKKSIYSGRVKNQRALNMSLLLSQVEHIDLSIKNLDTNIDTLLNHNADNDSQSLGSNLYAIPGIGPKTIAALLSVTGQHGEHFNSPKHLIGYIGFYPKIYQSGETFIDNHISKRGPNYLRSALYIAAVSCLKHNPELRNIYLIKKSQGKSSKQALICVAKKIAHLCLSMLKSGESYRPQRVLMPA